MVYEVKWNDAGHVTRHLAEDPASVIAWGEQKLSSGIGVVWVSGPGIEGSIPLADFKRTLING